MHKYLAFFLLAGCSAPPPAPPVDPFPPPAAGQGIQIKTDPYTLAPATEKYYCYTKNVDVDTAAIEVDVHNGALVHHLAVFETLADEPAGFSECPSQIKQTWIPLYGGGRNTPGVKLPAGAGFKFHAGQQILVQLHLVNATMKEVTETTAVNLLYAADPASLTPAGIFALGNMSFDIPAGATQYPVVGKCSSPRDLNVFALFPHMHLLGTSIAFEHGPSEAAAQMVYKVDPWSFGDQPMKLMDLSVKSGDFLRATCTYDNPGASPVAYGESTYDEMCFMVLFYTPFDHLNGCVN
jgi:hypothetical protein